MSSANIRPVSVSKTDVHTNMDSFHVVTHVYSLSSSDLRLSSVNEVLHANRRGTWGTQSQVSPRKIGKADGI